MEEMLVLPNIHKCGQSLRLILRSPKKARKKATLVCISQRKHNLSSCRRTKGFMMCLLTARFACKDIFITGIKINGLSVRKWWGGGVWGRSRQQVFVSRLINLLFYITCFLSKWKTCCELPGNHWPELLCGRTENIVFDECFRCRLQSHHQQHNTAYIHTCTRSSLNYQHQYFQL